MRLIGVGISGWPEQMDKDGQLDLFESALPARPPQHERLAAILDAIRHRFGPDAIQWGLSRHTLR